jgi:hypothetical protein
MSQAPEELPGILRFVPCCSTTSAGRIAALAILETPTSIEDENPQETGLFVVGKIEDPPSRIARAAMTLPSVYSN